MFVPFGFTTRRRPFVGSAAAELSREMDRMLSSMAAPRRAPYGFEDKEDALHITLDVPGLGNDELEIALEGEVLTVVGERQAPALEGYEARHLERSAKSFRRSFELPCRVRADEIEANLSGGVLSLRLPKTGEEERRTITIQTTNA